MCQGIYSIPEGQNFMIRCSGCRKWQHRECEGVSLHASQDFLDGYRCEYCRPASLSAEANRDRMVEVQAVKTARDDKKDYNQKYHTAITLTANQRDARRKEFIEWYSSNLWPSRTDVSDLL